MSNGLRDGILFWMFLCSVQLIDADYGRSPLIEYIITQEAKVAMIQNHDYVEFIQSQQRSGLKLSGSVEYLAIEQQRKDLEKCIDLTLHDIEIMSDTGALFNVCDDFGKTALNYCQTREFYNKLRSCGMPFQYDAWASINRSEINRAECIAVSVGLFAVIVTLHQRGAFDGLYDYFRSLVK